MATVAAAVAVLETVAVAVAVGGRGTVRLAVLPLITAPSSLQAAVRWVVAVALIACCGRFAAGPYKRHKTTDVRLCQAKPNECGTCNL